MDVQRYRRRDSVVISRGSNQDFWVACGSPRTYDPRQRMGVHVIRLVCSVSPARAHPWHFYVDISIFWMVLRLSQSVSQSVVDFAIAIVTIRFSPKIGAQSLYCHL